MANKQWFREAGFGMMVHWGLYSLLAGEYRGQRMGNFIGEWAQSYFQIPKAEYARLAEAFNPIYFDAEEWVKIAIDAGMQYMVVTSKHHDGFALFHSRVDSFNVVDATPFGRDVIGELAEACAKHKFKLGLYYSQALDWREENGGGYDIDRSNLGLSWCNNWDFPDNSSKNYTEVFERKIKPQVAEILTQYGDLALIWFDTPISISESQSVELYNMVKKYQPDCLVNSRIGNFPGIKYDYHSWGDNEIPREEQDRGMLFETPATLNDTWGYKAYDQNWKSADQVIALKKHLNERGVNYLLNVGPDGLGRIPGPSVDILREVGRKAEEK